jgi:hypothetical protein
VPRLGLGENNPVLDNDTGLLDSFLRCFAMSDAARQFEYSRQEGFIIDAPKDDYTVLASAHP